MKTFDVTPMIAAYRQGERGRVAWEVAQLSAFFERERWELPPQTQQSRGQTMQLSANDSSVRSEDT